jgi:serine/threonine protein kinase
MPEPQQAPPSFGRYKDPVMLGSGGMGAVYRAIDPQLDRYVAIKVLTHREPRYLERFRREAQVLAKIMHPSIIQIYEIVGSDEGQSDPYIVMEFFEGRPLDAAVKAGPLPQATVVSILRQTADGLKKAHVNQVIHRDIKPANIMLADNGDAKILDFGIAKLRDAKKDLTGQTVLGTPYYMSPEQAMGHPIDQRTDIYSLGVTAFHLLTAKRPFEAKSKVDVMLMQVKNALPDISTFVQVDPRVQRIVEKMCSKQAAQRYQDTDELIAALDGLPKSLGGKQTGPSNDPISDVTGPRVSTQQFETAQLPARRPQQPIVTAPIAVKTPPRPTRPPEVSRPAPKPQQAAPARAQPMPAPAAKGAAPKKSGAGAGIIFGVLAAVVVLGAAAFYLLRPGNDQNGRVPPHGWVKQGDSMKKIHRQGGYGNCVFSSKEIDANPEGDAALSTVFSASEPVFGRCFFAKKVGNNKQGEIWQELWVDGVKRAQIIYEPLPGDEESIPLSFSQQQAQRLADLAAGKHTLDVWIYRQSANADAAPLAAGELIVRK